MKERISSISPYFFEGFLIISLDPAWTKYFGAMPTFDVFIDKKKRLLIISKQSIKNYGDIKP